MTIEEKAKAYDKALNTAREILDHTSENYLCTHLTKEDIKDMYIRFFPELAGSEDEKVRKALIEMVHDTPNSECEQNYNVRKEEALAWLEKQDPKKHEEELEKAYKTADEVQYRRSYEDATKEMEKQGESCTKKSVADLNEFVKEYSFNIPSDIYNLLPKEKRSTWINEIESAVRAGVQWYEKQSDSPIKWNKNTKDCKPKVNHSVLMKTTHGIAEGEWQGEYWHQYRWAGLVRDTDVLSWMELSDLEKQGEKEPTIEMKTPEESLGIDSDTYNEIVDECIYGENKPADKVEPKCEESKTKIFDAPTPFEDKLYAFVLACEILVDPSKREFILEHSQEILDAAREQIGKEQKPTWSKEDRTMAFTLMRDINQMSYISEEGKNERIGWLNSLDEKFTSTESAWSEVDEKMLVDAYVMLDWYKGNNWWTARRIKDWLKSLKERIGG